MGGCHNQRGVKGSTQKQNARLFVHFSQHMGGGGSTQGPKMKDKPWFSNKKNSQIILYCFFSVLPNSRITMYFPANIMFLAAKERCITVDERCFVKKGYSASSERYFSANERYFSRPNLWDLSFHIFVAATAPLHPGVKLVWPNLLASQIRKFSNNNENTSFCLQSHLRMIAFRRT